MSEFSLFHEELEKGLFIYNISHDPMKSVSYYHHHTPMLSKQEKESLQAKYFS